MRRPFHCGLLPSQRGNASRFRRSLGNVVKSSGDTCGFINVQVESGTKEKGGQTTGGIVVVSGAILRNEKPFAECTLQNGVPVAVDGGGVFPPGGDDNQMGLIASCSLPG